MKETRADCYIMDREGKCLGPYTALQAKEILEVSPFGCLLLRSGCLPVWSEDLEGVVLTLSNSGPFSPVPPPAELVKEGQDLFDGSLAFTAVATQHYAAHKGWFETNRNNGRLKKPISIAVDSSIDLGTPYPRPSESRKKGSKSLVWGSSGVLILGGLVGLWQFSLSAKVWPFERLQGNNWALSPYERADFSAIDLGAAEESALRSVPSFTASQGSSSAERTSLRARSPAALRELSRVVQAKLENNPSNYTERLLGLLPYYRSFDPRFLPTPEVVGVHAVAFLDPDRREAHPVWRSIRGLAGGQSSRGTVFLAQTSRTIEEHVAKLGSWRVSSVPLTDGLWAGSRSLSQLQPLKAPTSQRVYWGADASGEPNLRDQREGAQVLVQLLAQLGAGTQVPAVPQEDLSGTLVARALSLSAVWVAGTGDPQLGRNTFALSETATRLLSPLDARIFKLLGAEAQQPFSLGNLQARFTARMGLIRALQQENGFLCSPDRAAYSLEFLLQTVRMAGMTGALLPSLHPVYNACFFQPKGDPTQPAQPSLRVADDSGALLSYAPRVPSPLSPEWRLFSGESVSFAPEQSQVIGAGELSILREWLALVAFSSTNSELRERVARAFVLQECTQGASAVSASPAVSAGPSAPATRAPQDRLCLQARWYGLEKSNILARAEVLKEISSIYGPTVASQVFSPWFASLYLPPRLQEDLPSDPRILARKLELDRYLDVSSSAYATLQWFARQGVPQ